MHNVFSYSRSATFPYTNPRNSKSIKHTSTQTELQSDNKLIDIEEILGNDNIILNQDNKKIYILALKYVNKFHDILNEEFNNIYENLDEENTFRCPKIPNYSSLFPLVSNFTITDRYSHLKKSNYIPELDVTPFKLLKQNSSNGLNLLKYKNSFEIIDNDQNVRKKTLEQRLVIEPCTDLLEYSKSKEKLKNRPVTSSYTPKKVKQMFDAISQDSKKNYDSDDSIILDDEQFERQTYKRPSIEDFFIYKKHSPIKHLQNKQSKQKSNPLKLNEKDLTNINEKTLNTIGIFTNRGEIKPDIIDMLEKQKSLKANDLRNKQFRSKRQCNFEIHLNPKPDFEAVSPSVASEKSFISYSDIKIHVQNIQSQ